MKKEDIKLSPCPFCGHEPTLITRHGKDGFRDRYSVLCDYDLGGCGAESGWYHYVDETVAWWNSRTESKNYLKEIYNWAYSNMECCDEPEWSLFSGIADVIAKYWREIEFNKLFKDSKYKNDDIAF